MSNRLDTVLVVLLRMLWNLLLTRWANVWRTYGAQAAPRAEARCRATSCSAGLKARCPRTRSPGLPPPWLKPTSSEGLFRDASRPGRDKFRHAPLTKGQGPRPQVLAIKREIEIPFC